MHHRRPAHDYEALPAHSAAMSYLAVIALIALMARRLTRESTPIRRGLSCLSKAASRDETPGENVLREPAVRFEPPAKREFSVMADGQLHLGA